MKILIAEDDDTSLLILSRTLEGMGYNVEAVGDGAEAWNRVQGGDYQLVISDWMMPTMDGPELCRKIRTLADRPYIYVILLTAKGYREDRLEALGAGADDFLIKPLDKVELAARLTVARRILTIQQELRDRACELERLHAELRLRNAQLAELATTDGLTGLKNHRHFREHLGDCFSLAIREKQPLSVVLLDVDQFKSYNDTFGHPAGDEVLVAVAHAMRQNARHHDMVARYGGEEFVIIMQGAEANAARFLAERLRTAIEAGPWPHRPVTASFGVATLAPTTLTASQLVEEADKALYQSKVSGRNRVTHHLDLAPLSV